MYTICKDYAILYKGLDRLPILASAGSWNQSLMETEEQLCILYYGVRNIMWIKVFLNRRTLRAREKFSVGTRGRACQRKKSPKL